MVDCEGYGLEGEVVHQTCETACHLGCERLSFLPVQQQATLQIPDVTVVIDSCLAKEVKYDAERRVKGLQMSWAS